MIVVSRRSVVAITAPLSMLALACLPYSGGTPLVVPKAAQLGDQETIAALA